MNIYIYIYIYKWSPYLDSVWVLQGRIDSIDNTDC